jgi:hypothetical protein
MNAEHIAAGVVSTANGAELRVTLVLALRPVDQMILAINADIQTLGCQFALEQQTFSLAGKKLRLLIKEVDFVVERSG